MIRWDDATWLRSLVTSAEADLGSTPVTQASVERAKQAARRERAVLNDLLIPQGRYVDDCGSLRVIPRLTIDDSIGF